MYYAAHTLRFLPREQIGNVCSKVNGKFSDSILVIFHFRKRNGFFQKYFLYNYFVWPKHYYFTLYLFRLTFLIGNLSTNSLSQNRMLAEDFAFGHHLIFTGDFSCLLTQNCVIPNNSLYQLILKYIYLIKYKKYMIEFHIMAYQCRLLLPERKYSAILFQWSRKIILFL